MQEQLPQSIQFHGTLTLQFPTISIVIVIVIVIVIEFMKMMKMICTKQSIHQSILDLDWNVTDETALFWRKQVWLRTWMDERTTSSTNTIPQNAPFVIRDNFERYWNVMNESDVYSAKQSSTKSVSDSRIGSDFICLLSQIVLYSIVFCHIAFCCIVSYSVVLCYIILCYIVLYCILFYCIVLYCIVVYSIVLYWIVFSWIVFCSIVF
jgi:hypothetical protein